MSNHEKDWGKIKDEFEKAEFDTELPSEAEVEPTPNNSVTPDIIALEQELSDAKQQAQDNLDKALRSAAELKNVSQRADREIQKAHLYGIEKFVVSLLPMADSLEQALQLVEKDDQSSMKEGLTLTLKLFNDSLQKQGVEAIDPLGEAFNPEEHEAMAMQAFPDVADNTIAVVFQKGYKLNGRVIRAARVIVAKSV